MLGVLPFWVWGERTVIFQLSGFHCRGHKALSRVAWALPVALQEPRINARVASAALPVSCTEAAQLKGAQRSGCRMHLCPPRLPPPLGFCHIVLFNTTTSCAARIFDAHRLLRDALPEFKGSNSQNEEDSLKAINTGSYECIYIYVYTSPGSSVYWYLDP